MNESENLEFKKEVENFREVSKTACAFANAFGGRLLIGVDSSGVAIGVQEKSVDVLQQRIEGAVQQVSPVPFHKISIEKIEGRSVVVLEVYQIGHGSFCTLGGIVYYRSGSVNTKLEGRTLQNYLVRSRILSFDDSNSEARIEDVDAIKVSDFLKKRSPSIGFRKNKLEKYLINLGVAKKNGTLSIKNTCVLFFAKEPKRFIPQNEIKMVRFKGVEPIEVIDARFANSSILENLKEAENFIKRNTAVRFTIKGLERVEVSEYPEKVVREALANAVLHRDYFSRDGIQLNIFDDRIEVINPGTLPEGLKMQILGSLSVQRNPLIYELMREAGLVEGLATGIPMMRFEMMKSGLPEPNFEEIGSFFKLTLYNKTKSKEKELSERQKIAMSYVERNQSITSDKYQQLTRVSKTIAVKDLNALCLKGMLTRKGKTRGVFYQRLKPN